MFLFIATLLFAQNDTLKLSFNTDDASFKIQDKRCERTYQAEWGEGLERFAPREVQQLTNGVSFRFAAKAFASPLTARLELAGERLSVTLEGNAGAAWQGGTVEYPYPITSRAGERLLLPNGQGYSFPVEMRELGDRYQERALFYTRELRLGMWGQFAEQELASGEVVPSAGYMAVVETPCNVFGVNTVRSNNLRAFNVAWAHDKRTFGHTRKLYYEFMEQCGAVACALRYREVMRRRGYLRTFAEKQRRHPEMAENYNRIMRSPSVWYWAIDGGKAQVAKALREECGFGPFLFQFASRKDLGTWVTGDEVRACRAAVPDILVSEYDIYKDTMESKYLPYIDYVRPYWSVDAADAGDIVLDAAGKPVRGWPVDLKQPVDGKKQIGCATICEQRAPEYARRRIASELKDKPYNARYLDVTGHALGDCYHPRHPHNRRESIGYRRALLALVTDEFHLLTSSEDGIECFVPECDYFTCGFSGPDYYRVDGGRWMWRIYDDAPPPHIMLGLDPALKVPLWEMVFHDCTVCYWDWCDYNNKFTQLWRQKDLWNAVSATPPLYFFNPETWARFKGQLAASYKLAMSGVNVAAGAHITAYRYLNRARTVHRSEWSNGASVTVNFSAAPFTLPDGTTLPALSVITSR